SRLRNIFFRRRKPDPILTETDRLARGAPLYLPPLPLAGLDRAPAPRLALLSLFPLRQPQRWTGHRRIGHDFLARLDPDRQSTDRSGHPPLAGFLHLGG